MRETVRHGEGCRRRDRSAPGIPRPRRVSASQHVGDAARGRGLRPLPDRRARRNREQPKASGSSTSSRTARSTTWRSGIDALADAIAKAVASFDRIAHPVRPAGHRAASRRRGSRAARGRRRFRRSGVRARRFADTAQPSRRGHPRCRRRRPPRRAHGARRRRHRRGRPRHPDARRDDLHPRRHARLARVDPTAAQKGSKRPG